MSLFDLMMAESANRRLSNGRVEPLVGQLRKGLEDNGWDEGSATLFNVRGANYLDDKLKYASDPSVFDLIDVDMFVADSEELSRSLRYDENQVEEEKEYSEYEGKRPNFFWPHEQSYVQRARKAGDDRFFFLVHIDAGIEHLVATFAVSNKPEVDDPNYLCWQRFLEGDSQYRNSRFKIIPFVVEGPWIVKKAVGSKPIPAIIGNKLSCYWEDNREAKVVEFYSDLVSSVAATTVLSVVKGASNTVILDLAFLIEAQEEDELPERILGVIRVSKLNLSEVRHL